MKSIFDFYPKKMFVRFTKKPRFSVNGTQNHLSKNANGDMSVLVNFKVCFAFQILDLESCL